jgi:LytTr DNA-binding domain
VSKTNAVPLRSFWWFQTGGWGCFFLLSVLVVLPYFRQPWELGYQNLRGLFADQVLICLAGFFASLVLRPVCHSLAQRAVSWLTMEVGAAAWSLAIGTSMALIVSRLTVVTPEPIELLEACAKVPIILFLWCNLYFGVKQSLRHTHERERLRGGDAGAQNEDGRGHIYRFTVRTGSRIQVVPAEDVAWICAAGDYVELHTRNATHLVRDTMNSLGKKLDEVSFARIHRSKIINLAYIVELRSIENREYIVKLNDGSQHRSSRTYSDRLEPWLRSQN